MSIKIPLKTWPRQLLDQILLAFALFNTTQADYTKDRQSPRCKNGRETAEICLPKEF
jgi:hypothetical protein